MLKAYILYILIPLCAGAALDLLFGDPLSAAHPVVLMGRLISWLENRLYVDKKKDAGDRKPDSTDRKAGSDRGDREAGLDRGDRKPGNDSGSGFNKVNDVNDSNLRAGALTALLVCLAAILVPVLLTAAAGRLAGLISPAAGRAAAVTVTALLCWQMLAAKSLKTESMKVYSVLMDTEDDRTEAIASRGIRQADVPEPEDMGPMGGRQRRTADLDAARRAVSMIVGRDTEKLDEQGIIRAAVETVAENTSDGVIAPMFYMALFGIPGMYMYKAVNTMDSMIGYKNERYLYFGRTAARADDILNFLPARISGIALILAACIHRECDGRHAFRIFRKDRRNSASPNAGCGEAAVAGALHIRLLGPARYFGILHEKPFIGTDDRQAEPEDIRRANDLMYLASGIVLIVILAASAIAAAANFTAG